MLAAVHASNLLECIVETLRHALNTLAATAPEWLRQHVQPEWVDARRAGIEGTISQGTRAFGLRRSRIGQAKTHLQHVLAATAVNLVRVANWLADVPLAKTRRTTFERLMLQSAYG